MNTIAAIIVSYNRSTLLERAIYSILNQSLKPSVLIIFDNNSTENTLGFLNSKGFQILDRSNNNEYEKYILVNDYTLEPVDILFLRAFKNSGSAGALNIVFRDFYDLYSWFWVMDDDGMPAVNCLELLFSHSNSFKYICPLVVSIENNSMLSFSLNRIKSIQGLKNLVNKGIIRYFANPWNGLLISTEVIKEIGNPIAGMFIWGEEIEYFERVKKKFTPITVYRAIFQHPEERLVYSNYFFGIGFVDPSDIGRKYLFYRNQSFILSRYYKYKWVLFLMRYTFYFIFVKRFDFQGLSKFFIAFYDGLIGNFEKS